MFLIFNFFIFIFGLIIGSFLNCVIYRLEKEQSFLKGRSFCPHCKYNLIWRDLIPVFSFLFLGGKCRYCHKKISIQYPLVELAAGIMFVLIFNLKFEIFNQFEILQFPYLINLFFLFYIAGSLIIIFVYDLKRYIILDKVLFPAIAIVFLYQLIFSFRFLNFNPLWAGLGACAFFLFIFLVSGGRWMGFGDVKLAFFMGLFLGYPNILAALFLAF
ncbi:MAG: prepilin peptidase, partial [Candidatus Staskawiczbacteria bacterium]|nr:prepilin peptidase [Candidatus Staskawiczbacteria bacterium]